MAGERKKRTKEQFFRETAFMQRLVTHMNVLSMNGYLDRSEPIMLILEYVSHRDLFQWLRNRRLQVKLFFNVNNRRCKIKSKALDTLQGLRCKRS